MLESLSERPAGDVGARFLRRQLRWRLILCAVIGAYILALLVGNVALFPMPHQLLAATAQSWLAYGYEQDALFEVPQFLLKGYYSQCHDLTQQQLQQLGVTSGYCGFYLELPLNTVRTVSPWVLGTLLGAMGGRLFALLCAESRYFRWTLWPSLLVLYLVPIFALSPIISNVLMELGYTPWVPRAVVAFIASFLVVIVKLMTVMHRQQSLVDLMDAMGASNRQMANSLFWPVGRVTFYEILPTAAGAALFAVIFAELPIWQTGGLGGLMMLGFKMLHSHQSLTPVEAWATEPYAALIWTSFCMILLLSIVIQTFLPVICYRRLRDYQREELSDDL